MPGQRTALSRGACAAFACAWLTVWGAAPVGAASQAGTSGAQFLKLGAGSRAGGMAEAYAAVADDVYAIYYNPAAATLIREPELAAAHTSHIQGSNYEFLGFAYPLRSGRRPDHSRDVLGAAIYNLSFTDIEKRGLTDTTDPQGTFGTSEYAYALTYGWRRDRRLGLGANAKLIHQTLDSYGATAVAADLGAHYTPFPDARRVVHYAAALRNFGTRPSFAGGESDPLPLGFTLGAGSRILPQLRAEVDVTKYRDTDLFVAAGGEYGRQFGEGVEGLLRLGYSSHRKDNGGLNGITLGFGVNFHRASFDFAWVPFGDVGDTFRYSLVIRFGGGVSPAAAPAVKPSSSAPSIEKVPVVESPAQPAAPPSPAPPGEEPTPAAPAPAPTPSPTAPKGP